MDFIQESPQLAQKSIGNIYKTLHRERPQQIHKELII